MKKRGKMELVAAVMSAANDSTVTEIAAMTNVNGKLARTLCDTLERHNLIVKNRSREFVRDREVFSGSLRDRYTLTDSGRTLLEAINRAISLF